MAITRAPSSVVQDDRIDRSAGRLDRPQVPRLHGGTVVVPRARAETGAVRRLAAVPAVIDQLPLGPIETNCYLVRAARGATEAVVVDPSGDAATIRLRLAAPWALVRCDPVTHGHWDHILGVADLAEGTGAPVYMAEGERVLLEEPGRVLCGADARSTSTGHPARKVTRRSTSPASRFGPSQCRDIRPAHLAFATGGCLFSGDVLFAGIGRPDRSPGRDWETLRRVDSVTRRRIPARDGRLSRATGRRRRSARSSRETRSSTSCGRSAQS